MGSSIDEEETQVLMVTLNLPGHFNPMLNLAKRLVLKNIHVTIASLECSGAIAYPIQSPNPLIHLELFSNGLADDVDPIENPEVRKKAERTEAAKNLSNLINRLGEQKRLCCIIANPFLSWAVDVAAKFDIPCAVVWIQASALYSIFYRYFMKMDSFPDLNKLEETLKLPGMPVLKVCELPTLLSPSSPYRDTVYEFVSSLDKVKWVLGSSFYELEDDIINSMDLLKPIIPIGPIVSPFLLGDEETMKGESDDDYCIKWLDKKPLSSVIYISFGSLTVFTQNQIDSIATALKNTKKMFLWVIRSSPGEGSSSSCALKVPEFIEEDIGNEDGLIVPWCSQERVLKHKSLACFMTHGGWNSTLETIVAGVPVIVSPGLSDQPVNAKLLSDVFEIGVKMNNNEEDGQLKVEEVERCIIEVTEGPKAIKMKKNAVELREKARKAVDLGGSSDQNMNEFYSQILGKVFT